MPCSTRLAVFDYDGVFSNGKFYFGGGTTKKSYHGRDSLGLKKLIESGIVVGIITNDVTVPLNDAHHIYSRIKFVSASESQDKQKVLTSWKEELGLEWNEIAYMGDDEPDIPCLRLVGLSGAPQDALDIVKYTCSFVSSARGGKGAVREFCEHIISRQSCKACICVPARLHSSRLPSKLLLQIDGVSIVRRTCLQCMKTNLPLFVFTDSTDIAAEVSDFATVFLTKGDYENGTERLSKNEHHIPAEFGTIINVQADEPFVAPENIIHALSCHKDRAAGVFYTTLHEKCDTQTAANSARVKVAVSQNFAHWYSRSVIPYNRSGNSDEMDVFTGIYVFEREMLRKFATLDNTPCQLAESVEQLKVIEHGYRIASFPTVVKSSISVDTYDDFILLSNACDTDGNKIFDEPKTSLGKRVHTNQQILDCTLRDGGYVNNWMFDEGFVRKFLPLVDKVVDIVEVGFINKPEAYRSCPVGIYRNLSRERIASLRMMFRAKLAVMTDLNVLNREVVFPHNGDIDIIRIAFSKGDVEKAKQMAKELLDAGYEVCLNFMSSHLYLPDELASHALAVPQAVPYVVDSLGCMTALQVEQYSCVLSEGCGLHVHNNLQQAAGIYETVKCRIIDATLNGMGRGAGNLPLELCHMLNSDRERLLRFCDQYMSNIPRTWGYAPEYVLQARTGCHPNYVVKMKDMGIDFTYMCKVLSRLEGVASFKVEKLYDIFSTLEGESFQGAH